jgi:hypothetical protein
VKAATKALAKVPPERMAEVTSAVMGLSVEHLRALRTIVDVVPGHDQKDEPEEHGDGELITDRELPFDYFHERSVSSWLTAVFLELMSMTPRGEGAGIAALLVHWSHKFEENRKAV